MREFKKGDKVVCVDSDHCGGVITVGKVYTVLRAVESDLIDIDRDDVGVGGYFSYRFELVDERQALSDAIDLCLKHDVRVSVSKACVYTGDYVQGKECVLDKVFPPSPTAQELEMEREIARIETEMRALADSLAKLKA